MPSSRVLSVKWCVPMLGRCVAKAGTRVAVIDWCVATVGIRVGAVGPRVATIASRVPTVGTRVAMIGTHAPIFATHRGMILSRAKISVARGSGRLLVGSAIFRHAAHCATDRANSASQLISLKRPNGADPRGGTGQPRVVRSAVNWVELRLRVLDHRAVDSGPSRDLAANTCWKSICEVEP
jgi:hypothetical protein